MALLTAVKELAIRAKLVEVFTSADAFIFSRPRQIVSNQQFVINTSKTIFSKTEIRYLEFYFVGFEDILDEAQLDEDCVPVRCLYRGQVGFGYAESRIDGTNSHDSVVAFIIALRNNALDNGDLIVSSITHTLSRIVQVNELRIEEHPITEQQTHLWDFSFYVEVRN